MSPGQIFSARTLMPLSWLSSGKSWKALFYCNEVWFGLVLEVEEVIWCLDRLQYMTSGLQFSRSVPFSLRLLQGDPAIPGRTETHSIVPAAWICSYPGPLSDPASLCTGYPTSSHRYLFLSSILQQNGPSEGTVESWDCPDMMLSVWLETPEAGGQGNPFWGLQLTHDSL